MNVQSISSVRTSVLFEKYLSSDLIKAFVAIKYSKIIKSHCSFDYNHLISLYLLRLESEAERNVLMEEFYPQL